MRLIGSTTIHPAIFYSGKISGYITWLILMGYFLKIIPIIGIQLFPIQLLSIIATVAGISAVIISLLNLGRSTRLGLPTEETRLKTEGIYRLSRNPMYLGFNLLTIASILYVINIISLILGVYSIITYHFIVLGEEKFLEERFGDAYVSYKQTVRRYI